MDGQQAKIPATSIGDTSSDRDLSARRKHLVAKDVGSNDDTLPTQLKRCGIIQKLALLGLFIAIYIAL